MAKLPKSLIKKYGISKKAWAVFRGKKSNSTKLKTTNKMAKRRKTTKRKSSGSASSFKLLTAVLGGGVYGAGRQKLSQVVAPITNKIPGGIYADNVVLGAVSYLMYKHGHKLPMGKFIKEAGKAGVYIESALAGQDAVGHLVPAVSNSSSSTTITY